MKKVLCMTEHTFGIIFQKKLERANPFRKKIATHIKNIDLPVNILLY